MKANPLKLIRAMLVVVLFSGGGVARAEAPAGASPPPGVSVSELLEKGIYTEETKGDLDGAIAIYQQLIAQAKADDAMAAQAEYRLGECFLKTNRKEEAEAAFQKLVEDFPDQTDLVAKAREHLPGAPKPGPVPWVDGERQLMKLYFANGTVLGMTEYRANLVESGTGQIWRVGARLAAGTANSVSRVDAEAESFRPITSRWKHSLLGEVEAAYSPGEVVLRRAGESKPVTVKLNGPVIDNEEALDFMRRMPLAVGYKSTEAIFSTLGGNEIPVEMTVTGEEQVKVNAGTFDCYKIELSIGQTYWYSKDEHRYLVQMQVGGLTGKLVSVAQRRLDEPVNYEEQAMGVTLTAPPQWVVCRYFGQPARQSLIRAYDPEADAEDGGIRYFPTDQLSADDRKSSKAWAEDNLKEVTGIFGNSVKVRPDSWKACMVSGRPGMSFVADFTEDGKAKTYFSLCVLGATDSEHFVIISAPDKFDGLMKGFEEIVASYRRK